MRRVLVLSHAYLQPAHRGKLRALAARGLEVTVAIPQRWREPWFGRPIDVAWERQGGLAGCAAGSDLGGRSVRRAARSLPIAVIPQLGALAPHEPQHVPHEGLAIGFVGRLVPQKGLDTLLQALARQRGAKWRLTIVGDGPERERLEQLASELRLAARVRWTGGLPPEQVANLWQDLDVLVQPSLALTDWREANGQVLMEAMANEVVVLGTDSGVIPELIGDAGLVVPSGDTEALADAVEKLSDQNTRRALAHAGRARALRLY